MCTHPTFDKSNLTFMGIKQHVEGLDADEGSDVVRRSRGGEEGCAFDPSPAGDASAVCSVRTAHCALSRADAGETWRLHWCSVGSTAAWESVFRSEVQVALSLLDAPTERVVPLAATAAAAAAAVSAVVAEATRPSASDEGSTRPYARAITGKDPRRKRTFKIYGGIYLLLK